MMAQQKPESQAVLWAQNDARHDATERELREMRTFFKGTFERIDKQIESNVSILEELKLSRQREEIFHEIGEKERKEIMVEIKNIKKDQSDQGKVIESNKFWIKIIVGVFVVASTTTLPIILPIIFESFK